MKKLIRTFKQISILFLVITLFGCEEDVVTLPIVTAGFTYTLSDEGVATFINTSENADSYTWSFGDQDGTTSSLINPVFDYVVGAYTVKLTASNVSGSLDMFEDTIMILDNEVPLIALIGDATISLTIGDTFTDPGVTALDEVDGDITANVVVGGDTVDTSVEGTYVITYNVSDAQGNAAEEVERTVIVSAIACDDETEESLLANSLNMTFLSDPGTTATQGAEVGKFYQDNVTYEYADNPDPSTDANTSCKVGKVTKSNTQAWDNLQMDFADKFVFADGDNFTIKVFSPQSGYKVTLKLDEIGTTASSGDLESTTATTKVNEWEELTIPVGAVHSGKYDRLVIFFDLSAASTNTYYFDDLKLNTTGGGGGGSAENLILDFENNLTGIGVDVFQSAGELLTNPVSGGINTSPNVYAITYGVTNDWWGGAGFVVGAAALSDADTEYKVKLYSTVAPINVLFQVETNPGIGTVGNIQEITTANQWVEVTFTLQGGAGIDRVLIRPAVGNETGTKTNNGILYVDDIVSVEGTAPVDNCPEPPAGELLSNGGFEANGGDGACWQFNQVGGTVAVSTEDANTGTYSAKMTTGTNQAPNLKMEGFGKSLAGGVTVQVSFKYKFTTALGVGSIFQVLAFTEKTPAGAQLHELAPAAGTPLDTWNTYTQTFVTDAGITEGISLLLQLTGSGNDGAAGVVYVDDVQVTQL
jgi:hypothetical protein